MGYLRFYYYYKLGFVNAFYYHSRRPSNCEGWQ
jgi:hypothetical protein